MCDLLRSAVLSVHALTLPKQMESFLVKIYYLKNLKNKYRPAFDPSPGYYFLLITCEDPSSVIKQKVIASTQLFSTLLL